MTKRKPQLRIVPLPQQALDALWTLGVPAHMHDGIVAWCENARLPGGFLRSVIENDLYGAYSQADETNATLLRNTVMWFASYAPGGCALRTGAVASWSNYVNKLRNENHVEQ